MDGVFPNARLMCTKYGRYFYAINKSLRQNINARKVDM